jgi:IclR helix-turn-helix domain
MADDTAARSLRLLEGRGVVSPRRSLVDVLEVFDRWLLLPDHDAVEYVLAIPVANRFAADPLWGFIVSPSGGTKTELIASLSRLPETYQLSDLTPQTLISGLKGQAKASLLMRLDHGSVLTLKDFTTVLTIHREARQMILSQLREIYDGAYRKAFGTGETVDWEGKLGFVAGVTPVIDVHYSVYQVLGERFVQYRTAQPKARDLARKAMSNRAHEGEMRDELAEVVSAFIGSLDIPRRPPDLRPDVLEATIALSILTVTARSGVVRGGRGELELVPEHEAPTRLTKQLGLLGSALTVMHGSHEVGPLEYQLVKKVALDTIPARRLKVLKELRTKKAPASTTEVAESVRYPTGSTRRVLEDLVGHGLVETDKPGQGKADSWWMAPETRALWKDAEAL